MTTYRGPERRRHRLLDWRMVAALGLVLLVILVFYSVWSANSGRNHAFEQLSASRAAASRRIDILMTQIARLQDSADRNGELIARLQAQIEALRQQLIKAGINPVVPAPSAQSDPSPQPSASTRPSPRPTPTHRPSPRPTRTPTPSPTCVLIVICP